MIEQVEGQEHWSLQRKRRRKDWVPVAWREWYDPAPRYPKPVTSFYFCLFPAFNFLLFCFCVAFFLAWPVLPQRPSTRQPLSPSLSLPFYYSSPSFSFFLIFDFWFIFVLLFYFLIKRYLALFVGCHCFAHERYSGLSKWMACYFGYNLLVPYDWKYWTRLLLYLANINICHCSCKRSNII